MPVLGMDPLITKIDVMLLLTGELLVGQRQKRLRSLHEHHLVELLPADCAVLLLAQHPHFGGAAVTHRVIAFS